MKTIALGSDFISKLVEVGIVPDTTTKVIIEAEVQSPVYIHYTVLGDVALLDVVPAAAEGAVVKESSWRQLRGKLLWKREEEENGDR